MAEIRSTLEMVLERAARMEAETADSFNTEDKEKEGMRLAARFQRGEEVNLAASLAAFTPEDQPHVKKGAMTVFMRNITLPREEGNQAGVEKAMHGLMTMGPESGELGQVFAEMKSILDRYLDHKKQLKEQLEEQFAQQMGILEQNLAKQTGVQMKLQPSQHPKFAEEWQKIQLELSEQYGRALDQYKEHIKQKLA